MSWENRDWSRDGEGGSGAPGFGGPGGDWRGVRPALDNPLSWSLYIGRVFGIDIRVHVALLLFVMIDLFRSLGAVDQSASNPMDPFYTLIFLGGLFVIVLLHEFGHCFACRQTGGEANEILMWPLGGLAYCMPPNRWKAHLWTVAGGPLVNIALLPVFAIPLLMSHSASWDVAVPIPFLSFPGDWWYTQESIVWHGVYLVARANMILLLFNLLPMFPLDGGRFLQSLLWPKLGYVRSMRIALRVGYLGAIALIVYSAVAQQYMLMAIAIFGGITCYMTHKQLQFTEEMMGFQYDEYAMKLGREVDEESHAEPTHTSKRAEREAEKQAQQAAKDEAELDRLLQKIADSGMDSLTGREKKWLAKQSERKRGRQGG